jgi:isopenicillin-N epimerase
MTTVYGHTLLPLWTLEPGARHLNHGACPRVVQDVEAAWKARMEAQPTAFFQDILPAAIVEAAAKVAPYFGVAHERFAFVENATQGTNAVLRSLAFKPGDEILISDHVYNAVRMNLHDVVARTGVKVVEVQVGLPVQGQAQITAAFRRGLSERTKLIIADHIVSASAIIMPVAEIIALGRSAGVPVLIDGAHAPGMVDLDVDALGATWYVGNLHKWMCAPRGAAFVARAADAPEIHPTTISHNHGLGFALEFAQLGTRNACAWLAASEALAFHEGLGGAALRARNHALAVEAGAMLARAFRTETGGPDALFGSMATIRIPTSRPPTREGGRAVRDQLWRRHRIEAPVMALDGALWLRVSAAAYNEISDYEGLAELVMGIVGG